MNQWWWPTGGYVFLSLYIYVNCEKCCFGLNKLFAWKEERKLQKPQLRRQLVSRRKKLKPGTPQIHVKSFTATPSPSVTKFNVSPTYSTAAFSLLRAMLKLWMEIPTLSLSMSRSPLLLSFPCIAFCLHCFWNLIITPSDDVTDDDTFLPNFSSPLFLHLHPPAASYKAAQLFWDNNQRKKNGIKRFKDVARSSAL